MGLQWRKTDQNVTRGPIKVSPASDVEYDLLVGDDRLVVINETGGVVAEFNNTPCVSASEMWIEGFGTAVVMGDSTGIWVLTLDDGVWSIDDWEFEQGLSSALSQPYWVFEKNVTFEPSTYSGTITLTASEGVFVPQHWSSPLKVFHQLG